MKPKVEVEMVLNSRVAADLEQKTVMRQVLKSFWYTFLLKVILVDCVGCFVSLSVYQVRGDNNRLKEVVMVSGYAVLSV